jgi:hypothetical protein
MTQPYNKLSLDEKHTRHVEWEEIHRKRRGALQHTEWYYPNYFVAAEVKHHGYKHLAANYTNLSNKLGPNGTFINGLHNSLVLKPSQKIAWRKQKDAFIKFMFQSNVKRYIRDLLIRDLNNRYKAMCNRIYYLS